MPGLAMPFRQNRRRLGTAKISPRHARGKIFCLNRNWFGSYGVGDAVVVVSVVVLVSEVAGEAVAIGVDSAGVVVTVVLVVLLSLEVAGEGFTTVVLFSVFSAGEAAGATVSVFCSQAARSAALARIQMYFFIGYG